DYVGDLIQQSEAGLLTISNLGAKILTEVIDILAQIGLCLGTKVPDWEAVNRDELEEKAIRFSDMKSQQNIRSAPDHTSILQAFDQARSAKIPDELHEAVKSFLDAAGYMTDTL